MRLSLVASSLPLVLACNAVLGNDSVSLWSGDAAPDSTMAEDAAADSSPQDAGPATCASPIIPPITDAGPPSACPAVEAGACGPTNITTANSPWTPPTKPNNQCSPAEITAVLAACYAAPATAATCMTWRSDPKNSTCNNCVYSDFGAATYGPVIIRPGDYGLFNNPGCFVLLDPCTEDCAKIVQSYTDCEYESCILTCTTSSDALDNCESQSDTCACLPQAKAGNACGNAFVAAHSPAAACITASADPYKSAQLMIPLFCGPPDGGK